MPETTYWNFEECQAEKGTGVMLDSPEFPAFWGRAAGLVGSRVPVVKVTQGDVQFYLYNDHNEGWNKITVGRGGPQYRHRDLAVDNYVSDEVG